MTKSKRPHLRAIGYAIIGYTLWVLSDALTKLSSEAALPPYEVVASQGLFIVLFSAISLPPRKLVVTLRPRHWRAQMTRGCLSLGSCFFNVIALKHLPLTMFYVTVFVAPMLIVLLAALCLREHLTRGKVAAVIAGFGGVVIAVNPGAALSSGDVIGYTAALASTTCFVLSTVWLRRLTQTETVRSLVFFTGLMECVVGALLCALLGGQAVGAETLIMLAGMACFGMMGNLCNFYALHKTTAANVAQFHYTQIVAGAILGYLIWHDVPAFHTVIGAAIIIGSGLFIAARASATTNESASEGR